MRLAYWNGGLWAVGNGMASTSLVTYLAMELGASAKEIGLILAVPTLLGLVRLATPAILHWVVARRRFCIACYGLSAVFLLLIPIYVPPKVLPSRAASLTILIAAWGGYHLLEYLATIGLWSWLRDLVPQRIRGRFLGRRERFLTMGRVVGMLVSAGIASVCSLAILGMPKWSSYTIPAAIGGALMLVAIFPLARMAEPEASVGATRKGLREVLAPFRDVAFQRLLAFGVWFSLVNGLTQAAQEMYPKRYLELPLFMLLAFRAVMLIGQSALGPWIGRRVDHIGCRRVLIVSQILVAAGPLFYLLATPSLPYLLGLAYVAWIAYVGINVALPALLLKISRPGEASPHVAAYFAVTGLVYGLATAAGGKVFEGVGIGPTDAEVWSRTFLFAIVARLAGVFWLTRLIEPDGASGVNSRHSAAVPPETRPRSPA